MKVLVPYITIGSRAADIKNVGLLVNDIPTVPVSYTFILATNPITSTATISVLPLVHENKI